MRTAAHPYDPHTCSAWLELESLSRPPSAERTLSQSSVVACSAKLWSIGSVFYDCAFCFSAVA